MERKKLDFFMQYNDNGETKQKHIEIGFISWRMKKQYFEIMDKVFQAEKLADKIQDIAKKQLDVTQNKDFNAIEKTKKVAKLEEEKQQCAAKLEAVGDDAFFNSRAELVMAILKANNCNDPAMHELDFWYDCVEPAEIMRFLVIAINKDSQPQVKKNNAQS